MATNLFKNTLSFKLLRSSFRTKTVAARDALTMSPFEELKIVVDVKASKSNPIKVTAYGDQRTIACVCDDMRFMTLKKGDPMKCNCGYHFQLVDANKFWEKEDDKKD